MLANGVRSSWETVDTRSVRTLSIVCSWSSTSASTSLARRFSSVRRLRPAAISRTSCGPATTARASSCPDLSCSMTRLMCASGATTEWLNRRPI